VYALDATTGKQIWVFDPLNNAAIGRARAAMWSIGGRRLERQGVRRLYERPSVCARREDRNESLGCRYDQG